MAVPKFFEFFDVFLKALSDGETHKAKDVREFIAVEMHISQDDLAELLPSKRQSTFDNRVAWARTYLDRAGLIDTPARGQYCITEEGKKALASGEKIDLKYLERFESLTSFTPFRLPDLPAQIVGLPMKKQKKSHPWKYWMMPLKRSMLHWQANS